MMYFEVIKEFRKQVSEQKYRLTEIDKNILETDLMNMKFTKVELVPLDCPMQEIKEEDKPLNKPKRFES